MGIVRTSEESVFNMALAYLKRIDYLLWLCQISARRMDVDEWLNNLRAVQREISIKFKDDSESQPFEDIFKEINPLILNKQFKKTRKQEILLLLHKLEIKMRKFMQKKGMLLPSREDPRFAVLKK